jgi:hypothetical protein
MKRIVLLTIIYSLTLTGIAHACWGAGCYTTANNNHGYILEGRHASHLASIDFIMATGANVPEWTNGSLVTMEQWLGYTIPGWIETGLMVGSWGGDCCTLHQFYAEDLHGTFRMYVNPVGVPGWTYKKTSIYDGGRNGDWEIYWDGCSEWCLVGHYGGGWPATYSTQEAGMEVASNSEPVGQGRQEVATDDGPGPWSPWTGVRLMADPPLKANCNPEACAAGNISFGTEAAGGALAKTLGQPTLATYTAGSGGQVTAQAEGNAEILHGTQPFTPTVPTPRAHANPKGRYETLVRNSEGVVERMLLSNTRPTLAETEGD